MSIINSWRGLLSLDFRACYTFAPLEIQRCIAFDDFWLLLMTPARKKRLYLILAILMGVGVAVALMLQAFQQNMMFYYDPTQIKAGEAPVNRDIRIGGMVVDGSVQRTVGDLKVSFALTDYKETVNVSYDGILPDLFREGQGIVGRGRLQDDGSIIADEILAKHDENYMPPEVADSLKNMPPNGEQK